MKKIIKSFLRSKFIQIILSFCIFLYLQFVFLTSKKEYFFEDEKDREFYLKKNYILAFWHGRLAMMPFIKKFITKKINILISLHSDGRIIAYVMKFFLFNIISGSSTKGWVGAYKQMVYLNKQKETIVITPDGPRGPRQKVGNSNIVKLAKKFNLEICPTTFAIKRARIMKSWDRFVFPLPFSKVVFLFGKRINPYDSRFLSDKEVEEYFERVMNDLCAQADSRVGFKS